MASLIQRATYALDIEECKSRLTPVNINSKHYTKPKDWAKWAREHPPVGHDHLDPPEKPKSKHNKLTPEKRREVSRLGGIASSAAGIRKGFGGHKHLQDLLDQRAFDEGKRIVEVMVKRGYVDKETAGNEALAFAVGIVRGGEDAKVPVGVRLQAAKMVMEYTLAKPAVKQDVKVSVEDFLSELAEEANAEE